MGNELLVISILGPIAILFGTLYTLLRKDIGKIGERVGEVEKDIARVQGAKDQEKLQIDRETRDALRESRGIFRRPA